ncbi:hypothetical protein ACUNWD_20630 [Sunxiuqinia sp. A32]|uniref:hypothetical protein n=1 Tax=Sunxiuqinia sp. A32 TaxID=3461496 RepID=UPI004046625E
MKCNYPTFFAQAFLSLALVLSILPETAKAQDNNFIYSNAAHAEKIYLQLDGKIYTTGDIIWFKSIVSSAYDHQPSNLSKILYVELIGPDEAVIEKKLVKIENGIGQGFFYLNKELSKGLYLVRAYTLWDLNFGTNFFYKEYIQIFNSKETSETEKPISNIALIKEQSNTNHLQASLNPFVIDSLHKNKLTVFVSLDNTKDTLVIKKEKDNAYRIDYPFDAESQFATLQMKTAHGKQYSQTIILNNEYLDLQFFPESGELVKGISSKVGFKALDANGQGKKIQGDIIDERDSIITSFKSNSLGMGSFNLIKADNSKTYFARLKSQAVKNQQLLYPLPAIASVGNVLSIEQRGNNISIMAASNYLINDSINLHISFRGVNYYQVKAKMKAGTFRLKIPIEDLPEGIVLIKLMDKSMQPVAERLYFNERPESRINLALASDKNSYAKRELTQLTIEATDSERKPVNANLSLLVINKQQMGKMQHTRQNILSYFLLNSELRGEIENPGFYFRKDSCNHNDLDALMLTQGWRKYNYIKPFKELNFQPEQSLTVSGQVKSMFSNKGRKEVNLTMMTFGKTKSIYTQIVDSLGKFKFNLNDEYGQNMNVLLQSAKKSGKNMNYEISLDEKKSPTISFNHTKTVEKIDSVVSVFVEKNKERRKIDEAFPLQSGNILIEEVEVTGYQLTPNRKKVMERYGEPTEVIDGKDILAKEEKWSYGLYSVLLFNFPDKVRINRHPDGNLYAKVMGSDITLVVIDGIPVKYYEYPLIPNIPTSEVSSFEIIKCASNFISLYLEATNSIMPPDGIMCGSVIAIYTHGGKGIYGANKPAGLSQTSVPVFSAPREFYAPKYDHIQADDWSKPDLRALIDWHPILKTDSLGKASTSFYNADNTGEMIIVVEAISENGEIGYQELEYNVDGKDKIIIVDRK